MEKMQKPIGDPTVAGPITGGGRSGGGQFNLPKTPPMYEIWSKSQGKKVGEARTLQSARRVIDRRDNEYGAYDHYKKKIGD
jgi:hypothetical protein